MSGALVARLHDKEKAVGSIPTTPTIYKPRRSSVVERVVEGDLTAVRFSSSGPYMTKYVRNLYTFF